MIKKASYLLTYFDWKLCTPLNISVCDVTDYTFVTLLYMLYWTSILICIDSFFKFALPKITWYFEDIEYVDFHLFRFWMLPSLVLKKMVMGTFDKGYVDSRTADSIDFMVVSVSRKIILIFDYYHRIPIMSVTPNTHGMSGICVSTGQTPSNILPSTTVMCHSLLHTYSLHVPLDTTPRFPRSTSAHHW